MTIKLHNLRPAPGAKTAKTRVGRGEGSKGKTSGRGTKGTKARYQVPARFEGGQLPLHMRIPKMKGFKNPFKVEFQVVNLDKLGELFPEGGAVGVDDLGTRLQQRGGGDGLHGQATTSRDLLRLLQHAQRLDGRVHDVDLVRRPERLAQDVVDAGALQHRTHRATGDDAGTGSGRAQHDHAGGLLTLDRVRDGALDAGDAEESLLRLLDTLGDRRRHLLGFAVADTDGAIAIADHHQCCEAEATAALHHFGDAIDRDHSL